MVIRDKKDKKIKGNPKRIHRFQRPRAQAKTAVIYHEKKNSFWN